MKEEQITILGYRMPDTETLEAQLIASAISNMEFFPELMRLVKPHFFSEAKSKDVWEVMIGMYRAGETIDVLTISAKGGFDQEHFINKILSTDRVYGHGVLQLAQGLVNGYIRRKAYTQAAMVLNGLERNDNADKIVGYFNGFLNGLEDEMRDDSLRCMPEIAVELANDISGGKVTRIASNIHTLDMYLYGGFAGGSLVILAARPSVGKTTIALQMAVSAARKGSKVCFFSLEMTSKELAQRLIVGTGEVSMMDIILRNVDWNKYGKATQSVLSENMFVNDRARSLQDISTRIGMEARAGRCDIAFVDYLGLIDHDDKRKSQAQVIGDITRAMKNVAKENNIPVVLLCQLNRESAKESRSPQLYDLRDSGAIEQDADVVLMLERPKGDDGYIEEDRIDMWLRKNRGGRVTIDEPIRLRGNENYSQFVDMKAEEGLRFIREQDEKDEKPF